MKTVIENLLAEYDMSNSAFAKDLREALASAAKEHPAPSQYGSHEWQAMIAARAIKKYKSEQPAQQEPVAIALNTGTKQGVKWLKNVEHGEHLYTSPPAHCRTGLSFA